MTDWYPTSVDKLLREVSSETGLTLPQVAAVYSALREYGLIDYDIEKEVLYERYVGDGL